MKRYIVYFRPRKNLSQFVVEHNILVTGNQEIVAENKATVRRRFKASSMNRLYVIQEIIEI